MSAAGVSGLPSTCSGAIYAAVPMMTPVSEMDARGLSPSTTLASPKWVMTTRVPVRGPVEGTSITLPLLKSRWTMPRAWAASRPAATWEIISEGLLRDPGGRVRCGLPGLSTEKLHGQERDRRGCPARALGGRPVVLVHVEDAADVWVRHAAGDVHLAEKTVEGLLRPATSVRIILRARVPWSFRSLAS